MIKRFLIFLLLALFSFPGYGQYVIEVRDSQSDELLQGITLSGVSDYEVLPAGAIRISKGQMKKVDSLLVFKEPTTFLRLFF